MINEFSGNPTANHLTHNKIMASLSVTALIKAVDYITLLSQFINSDNEVLDDINEVLQPLNDVIEKLRTNEDCIHCGNYLYLSDLPQYEYVCPACDENFC